MSLIKELLICAAVMAAIMFFFNIGDVRGHEYGHAEGIYHLDKGQRTDGIDLSQACPGQDKVLLYHDFNNDGIMDLCSTLWEEHDKIHYILSDPDENGKCECEGYLWLEGDSQQ